MIVKRFYSGLLSLYFSAPLTMLAFLIFAVAFIGERRGTNVKPILIVIACILGVVMFFYYKNKLKISKTLKAVKNIEEYESGGMLDRSYILEDRMIAGCGFVVAERPTVGYSEFEAVEKGRKVIIHMTSMDESFDISAIDMEEASRFAAFIKRKNPDCAINITPKGNGTLQELGAGN